MFGDELVRDGDHTQRTRFGQISSEFLKLETREVRLPDGCGIDALPRLDPAAQHTKTDLEDVQILVLDVIVRTQACCLLFEKRLPVGD